MSKRLDELAFWLLYALLVIVLGLLAFERIANYEDPNERPYSPIRAVIVAEHENSRASEWPAFRKYYLQKHPECAACGKFDELEVHHVKPFQFYPEDELDLDNLITLCWEHHLVFGHLGDWRAFNPLVREDCERYRAELKARPKTKAAEQKFVQQFERKHDAD